MGWLLDHPFAVFAVALVLQWGAARVGGRLRKRGIGGLAGDNAEEYSLILAATLTLLGLIIGFSFSMATTRYDLRKNLEEAEANAIGTMYVRADLLPAADAVQVRGLLKRYVGERIAFYRDGDDSQRGNVDRRVSELQVQLWNAVRAPATAQPTAISALTVAGMNDVLNAQGYIQAALWNRIPWAAWWLMAAIALCCNGLIGYGSRTIASGGKLFMVLPLVVSIAFMLIADIDSPRNGLIEVVPQNLLSLAAALPAQ